MAKNIRLFVDKPTQTPVNSTRTRHAKERRQYKHVNEKQSAKRQKNIIIIVPSLSLVEIFQKISHQKLAMRPLVKVAIEIEVPNAAIIDSTITKKEDEKREVIFLDIYEVAPTIEENAEILNALTSNGFEVRITRHKVQEDLVYEARKWLDGYLDAI
jgi:hypothetical protein